MLFVLALVFIQGFTSLFAQPLSLRNSWVGKYDIRMVGSVALQPAFVSSTNPVTVTGFLTDDIMNRGGKLFTSNNMYTGFPSHNRVGENVVNGCDILNVCPQFLNVRCNPLSNEQLSYKTREVNTALVYADCDDDYSTFQSSWARLDFGDDPECVHVEAAYLYWIGGFGDNTIAYSSYPGTSTMRSFNEGGVGGGGLGYDTVLFKVPNSDEYFYVSAFDKYIGTVETTVLPGYVCVADVTNLLKNPQSGNYWVANIRSSPTNYATGAGWALVVVFSSSENAARNIVLYDGFDAMHNSGSSREISIDSIKVPSSGDFVSYLGIGVLDGENKAAEIVVQNGDTLKAFNNKVTAIDGQTNAFSSKCDFETLNFYTDKDSVYINPFVTDQSGYYFSNSYGVPYAHPIYHVDEVCLIDSFSEDRLVKGYDGILSSQITTYDKLLNKNGVQVQRMPNLKNTLGLDLHHLKLPKGAISSGAASAQMIINSGRQGAVFPFLAYLAIETVEPHLHLEMTSLESSVDLSEGKLTYKIKVYNTGGESVASGAYVVDSLDSSIEGLVDYAVLSQSNGISAILENNGIQVNQISGRKYLKFILQDSLPAADAVSGVGSIDTLIIDFTLRVSGVDNPNWNLKCRRNIKNEAWVYYGEDNVSGANLDACGAVMQITPVGVTSEVFKEYDKQYVLTVDFSDKIVQNPNLRILSSLKSILADRVRTKGVIDFDVDLYDFTYESGDEIIETDVFSLDSIVQRYYANYTDSVVDCSETYIMNVVLVNPLLIDVVKQSPSCYAYGNGIITVGIKGGRYDSLYVVSLLKGEYSDVSDLSIIDEINFVEQVSYSANSQDYITVIDIDTLCSGDYTLFVVPLNSTLESEIMTISLLDKQVYSLVLNSSSTTVCDGEKTSAYLKINGTPPIGDRMYIWEKSKDAISWEFFDSSTSRALSFFVEGEEYLRAKLNVGECSCPYSNILKFSSLLTPMVSLSFVDSACYEYDLHNLPIKEENGVIGYDLSLHRLKPKTALDNSSIIQEENYKITLPQKVYARMSVNNQCYTIDSIDILIKEMDDCYPIEVPEFFSPDGDGLNDLFRMPGLEEYNNPEVIVFNKQGVIVFRGGKYELTAPNGWDGTYLGHKLPSADYWYQIKFLEIKPKIGHFSIKRGNGE